MTRQDPSPAHTEKPRSAWSSVAAAYERWVSVQDKAAALQASSPRTAVFFIAVCNLSVLAYAKVPALAEVLQVQLGQALLLQIPWLCLYVAYLVVNPLERLDPRAGWLFILVGNACIEFWLASMMCSASTTGTLYFALFYIVGCGIHGYTYRSTVREPFAPLCSLVAGLAAVALASTEFQAWTVILVTINATATSVFMGELSTRQYREVARRKSMEAALQAEMMSQRSLELCALEDSLNQAMNLNHDAKNALAVMAGNLAYVRESVPLAAVQDREEFTSAMAEMEEAVKDATALLSHSRSKARPLLEARTEAVVAGPVVDQAVAGARWRFPGVTIQLDAHAGQRMVRVRGGEASLASVLTNLLANACQGDGQRHARTVGVRVDFQAELRTLCITVEDDGPGFSEALLSKPVQGFLTTKKDGTGLGLYTVERLLWASGGQLKRRNGPGGGAVVDVTLLEATPS